MSKNLIEKAEILSEENNLNSVSKIMRELKETHDDIILKDSRTPLSDYIFDNHYRYSKIIKNK